MTAVTYRLFAQDLVNLVRWISGSPVFCASQNRLSFSFIFLVNLISGITFLLQKHALSNSHNPSSVSGLYLLFQTHFPASLPLPMFFSL